MVLMEGELQSLRKANEALAKRRRAKRTRVQAGGALTVEDAQCLVARKEKSKEGSGERSAEGGPSEAGPSASRRCGGCGKAGHNIRTCQEVEEATSEEDCITCD